MRIFGRLLTVFLAASALAVDARGQSQAGPAVEKQTGLEVGSAAPKFSLQDQEGKERSLDEFLKQGKVALVFYRSADWCPFCRGQLTQLQHDLKAIEAEGIQLVGISYDSPSVLKTAAEKLKVTFPLLSDPGSKTIDEYHIRNVAAKGKSAGVPNPGIFVLDSSGVIRAKLVLDNYRERPTTEAIIKAAKSVAMNH